MTFERLEHNFKLQRQNILSLSVKCVKTHAAFFRTSNGMNPPYCDKIKTGKVLNRTKTPGNILLLVLF